MPAEGLLITGAAGFIGSNFVHYWLRNHPDERLVALDALTYAGDRANLAQAEGHPQFRFVHGDIRNQPLVEQLLVEHALHRIVHFAAESHVDRSISDSDAFLDSNVLGTHSLLKAARAVWLERGLPHRFHHVSTDEVYGSLAPADPGFHERSRYRPNSPYAASKAASDHLVRAWRQTWGLQTTTSNCCNNYGPRQHPEKLIPLCITNILRGQPLPVYGDGRQVRDWLHVEDHCHGIELVLERGRPGETYHIGADQEWHNIELVQLLCDALDTRLAADPELCRRFPEAPAARGASARELITRVQDRPGHDQRYAIDAGKIQEQLGYRPRHSLASGIEATLDWYLANPQWWRPRI